MEIIKNYLNLVNSQKEKIMVVMVTNVDNHTSKFDDYEKNSLTSEYLSELELEELNQGFEDSGFQTVIHFDETEFIRQIVENKHPMLNGRQIGIVLSMAQKGKKLGRKSLLPSFCDLYNLKYTSSNPYTVSLCRNKYHTGILLEAHGLKVPESWLYNKKGWLFGKKPPEGLKVITKLNNESASIGIDQRSVIIYQSSLDPTIHQRCMEYEQEIIVQEFIEGYEIEHPFIANDSITPLVPMGIQLAEKKFLNEQILTYEIRGKDQYSFYNYGVYNEKLNQRLIESTRRIALILGITGFGRIDYRINQNNEFFITDIATNPHIVKHSSFHNSFKELGYTYDEMLATFIAVTFEKYGL
ncbi:hypothetical protein E2R58_05040 [Paenibacillus amylolyticus]|uniref:hypothetical protein n=1 Tax=Paenibacillus TaxID=44249 RepID=UPI00105A6EA4|nr:hypothetical protein [Paenibacillus amylolyticus]TDL68566.1 hypothetical protein E2R58_05040 [Paenibacillus amylolyticus]